MFGQVCLLFAQLVDQSAANISGAGDEQIDLLVCRFEEFFVQDVQGLAHIGGGYHGRNIPFGGSLRDGAYVDAIATKGAEHPPTDAGVTLHLFTHEGYDGQVLFDPERFHFLEGDLDRKCVIHQVFGILAAGIVYPDADAVFGRTLGDEDDVDLALCQGFEKSFRETGHTYHTAAFEAEQCDVVDA